MKPTDLLELYTRRARDAFAWAAVFIVAGIALLAHDAYAQGADPTTEQLVALVNFCGGAFRAGEYFAAICALIVVVVLAVRLFGKRLHDLIPDDSLLDRPFWFLFDTKPGGIILNALTAAGLVLAPALLSGMKVTPTLLGATLLAGIGASQMYGWLKDLFEWWRSKQPVPNPPDPAKTPPGGGA